MTPQEESFREIRFEENRHCGSSYRRARQRSLGASSIGTGKGKLFEKHPRLGPRRSSCSTARSAGDACESSGTV